MVLLQGKMSSPISPPSGFRPRFLQTVLIIAAGFWVFSPALHGDGLWDDNVLITANPLMNDPDGLGKIWFRPGILIDFYPDHTHLKRLHSSIPRMSRP